MISDAMPRTAIRAWKGADSLELLGRMAELARVAGWVPINVDCTVVAERPRLAPFVGEMSERLSGVIGAPVNVKATRAEGLGALGRAEGIACTAVVLMKRLSGAGADPSRGRTDGPGQRRRPVKGGGSAKGDQGGARAAAAGRSGGRPGGTGGAAKSRTRGGAGRLPVAQGRPSGEPIPNGGGERAATSPACFDCRRSRG